jgi:hypothetical protein
MGLRSLIFILAVFIVFSGCVEEKNVIKTNESVYQEPENTTPENLLSTNLSSEVENLPEIELRSLSSIYTLDNYEKMYVLGYNITERRYLVYNLSIRNNGSKYLDFELDELNVRDGDTIYNAETSTKHGPGYSNSFREDMLLELEKTTKIEDKRLYPGQTISGSVIYQVNSSHNSSYDNAFQLLYKEIPVSSNSFKKSTEALNLAERYNYSIVFGISPYDLDGVFANYVNKSTIEFFKKMDSDWLLNDSTENRELPEINVVYAIKVIPEKSIRSIFERNISDPDSYPEKRFIVIDDTGEELINASKTDIIAILKNQTYELHSGGSRYFRGSRDIPQMNFSNATLVITSYQYTVAPGLMSFIDQDLILDDKMNIVEARYNCRNYLGA